MVEIAGIEVDLGDILNVGSSIAQGVISSDAADQAAAAQLAGVEKGIEEQKRQFDLTRTDLMPWLTTGQDALNRLSGMMGLSPGSGELMADFTLDDFQTDPGYEFRQAEGIKARENSAAARGGVLSGAQQKAIGRYGQDYASDEYQRAWDRDQAEKTTKYNRLAGISGTGQTTANTLGGYGAQSASQIANAYGQIGNVGAANAVAGGQAVTNTLSGLQDYYQLQSLIKK